MGYNIGDRGEEGSQWKYCSRVSLRVFFRIGQRNLVPKGDILLKNE